MLGMTLAHAANTTVPDPKGTSSSVFTLRPFEWIPSFRVFNLIPIYFPRAQPVSEVSALAVAGERLWINARPFSEPNLPEKTGHLWSFQSNENQLTPVRGAPESYAVSGLLTRGSQLWISSDNGVASLDSTSYKFDLFGPPQGLTSARFARLADTRRGLFALGESGTLFRLSTDFKSFLRPEGPSPVTDTPTPSHWQHFAGSGDWVTASTDTSLFFRHADAPQWNTVRDALRPVAPELQPATVLALVGDGTGRFWIGTDAGLWSLEAETGRIEAREKTSPLKVLGGLGVRIDSGMRPTTATIDAARDRMINGIRNRMKLRALHARSSRETGHLTNPVSQKSRIPGGIRALALDRGFLWIATIDPNQSQRSRILLFHPGSQKWVGWFPIGFPVLTLAVDDRYLWIGVKTQSSAAAPLYAVEKTPFLALPTDRWTPDAIDSSDLKTRISALPPEERAVYSFFSGDYASLVSAVNPSTATEEQLFLRALAHDPMGLDIPETLAANLRLLTSRFPNGLFTALVAPILASISPASPTKQVPALPSEIEDRPDTTATLMERRDLDGDGVITLTELRLWLGPKSELGKWDSNHNGSLDLIELQALLLTTNLDRKISPTNSPPR